MKVSKFCQFFIYSFNFLIFLIYFARQHFLLMLYSNILHDFLPPICQLFYLMKLHIKPKKIQSKNKKCSKIVQTLIQLDGITLNEFLIPQFKKQISLNVKLQLQKKTWTIQNEKYSKQKWSFVFRNLQMTDVKIISLFNNLNQKIISQINHVNFMDLQILEFDKNNISNIEKLCAINTPNLYHLSIAQNYITNLKSINKCVFPKLTCFKISQNFISQVKLKSFKVPCLDLLISDNLQQNQNNFVQFQDVSIFCKLEILQKRQVFLQYEQGPRIDRIHQKKIMMMHHQKISNSKSKKDKKIANISLNTQSFLNMMMTSFYK